MIVLGCLFDRNKDKEIFGLSKTSVSNAANTYQWNLIDGLKEVLSEKLSIINVLPVGTYPKRYKKLFLPTRKWNYGDSQNIEVGSINLPVIKQAMRARTVKKLLKKSDDKNIIIYSAYEPFLRACYKLDKSYNISLVVTDLPEYYDLQKVSSLRSKLRTLNNKYVYKYMKRIDSFVLLTEEMKYPLNVGNRPYTVVEGIASDACGEAVKPKDTDKKVILYTGTLNYKFGIKNLIDAFMSIDDENYELWICGGGEAETYIKEQNNQRIKFFGYVRKSEVYEMQKEATVLVNPRQNEGGYTKYSFPSKTMEYMASGLPVIMYKLSGIPDEYDKHLNYIPDNSVEAMKNKIIEICSLPLEEREAKGFAARKFVLGEKNAKKQAQKIMDLYQ